MAAPVTVNEINSTKLLFDVIVTNYSFIYISGT